ncbi:MAG TPA: glycoside hydrolase family 43 protein [Flavitalea sp.]|nr:glycoside hydrolase family 43 protein [Flavitalea sp.]
MRYLFILLISNALSAQIYVADPFVLSYNGKYYLYGTADKNPDAGIPVYVSDDMINWSGPAGKSDNMLALSKGKSFGTRGFWAPFVVQYRNSFYMYYTANEKIAVAISESPLGPFIQHEFKPMQDSIKEIDPHVFIDGNGGKYIYFVRLINGNRVYAAELSDDMISIKENTIVECISQSQPWEIKSGSKWPVTEAPAMLEYKNKYYLFYTANDFRSPDYNVGYAVSDSPLGPFRKYEKNPIISRKDTIQGTGGCEFVTNASNELIMFYHTHFSIKSVGPRRTVFSKAMFTNLPGTDEIVFKVADHKTFIHPAKQSH